MTYDAPIIILMVVIASVLAIMLLGAGRPTAATLVAFCGAAYFAKPVYWWAFSYARRPGVIEVHEWRDQYLVAEAIRERAFASMSYAPWSAVLVSIGAIACLRAWKQRRSLVLLAFSGVAAVPTIVLAIWATVSSAMVWSHDDPRWTWGYYLEWRRSGAPKTNAGPCSMILPEAARLRTKIAATEVDKALLDCKEVCLLQARAGHYNPGFLEGECKRAFSDSH